MFLLLNLLLNLLYLNSLFIISLLIFFAFIIETVFVFITDFLAPLIFESVAYNIGLIFAFITEPIIVFMV